MNARTLVVFVALMLAKVASAQTCIFYLDYDSTKIFIDGSKVKHYFKGDWVEKKWLGDIIAHNDTVHSYNDFISTIENKDSLQVDLKSPLGKLIDKREVVIYFNGKRINEYYRKRFKEKRHLAQTISKGYKYYVKETGELFFERFTKPGVIRHF